MTPQPPEQPRWHRYNGDHDCWAAGCDLAQPPPPAEAVRLLRLLAFDGESCRYDHHGHCQAHGFLDGDYRATGCPMAEARRYLADTSEVET